MKIVRIHSPEADKAVVEMGKNGGYCCCAIEKCDDTKCWCKDFRQKMEDPDFEGKCNCGVFEKTR